MKGSLAKELWIGLMAIALGCGGEHLVQTDNQPDSINEDTNSTDAETSPDDDQTDTDSEQDTTPAEPLCDGEVISMDAVEDMLTLTTLSGNETVYTTYERIDGIATLFEDCGDPWGMFPTTYRHITLRIIQAIENEEIADSTWGEQIVLDFASRYFANLEAALTAGELSYGWEHYYYLADNAEVSRTRAVLVAMVAHLTLDLPYALWEIGTTDDHEDDYFVLGELMIEITPNFIEDLRVYYDTDAEDILNGFFLGEWVDGVYGEDTMITLSYQTIRTKSWNNWRLLNSGWGWLADSEIYTSFWTIDGVLASLDAAGTI